MEEEGRTVISVKDIERITKELRFEADLKPYEVLSVDLYKLPEAIITGKKGLDIYLKELKNVLHEAYKI